MKYLVTWEIDAIADNHVDAAKEAFMAMQNPDTLATVFDVKDENGVIERIDLQDHFPLKE